MVFSIATPRIYIRHCTRDPYVPLIVVPIGDRAFNALHSSSRPARLPECRELLSARRRFGFRHRIRRPIASAQYKARLGKVTSPRVPVGRLGERLAGIVGGSGEVNASNGSSAPLLSEVAAYLGGLLCELDHTVWTRVGDLDVISGSDLRD